MLHRLDFDLGLYRLAAAADGGGSGDYITDPKKCSIICTYRKLCTRRVARRNRMLDVCNIMKSAVGCHLLSDKH